jgi:hypothetical protein
MPCVVGFGSDSVVATSDRPSGSSAVPSTRRIAAARSIDWMLPGTRRR